MALVIDFIIFQKARDRYRQAGMTAGLENGVWMTLVAVVFLALLLVFVLRDENLKSEKEKKKEREKGKDESDET